MWLVHNAIEKKCDVYRNWLQKPIGFDDAIVVTVKKMTLEFIFRVQLKVKKCKFKWKKVNNNDTEKAGLVSYHNNDG